MGVSEQGVLPLPAQLLLMASGIHLATHLEAEQVGRLNPRRGLLLSRAAGGTSLAAIVRQVQPARRGAFQGKAARFGKIRHPEVLPVGIPVGSNNRASGWA